MDFGAKALEVCRALGASEPRPEAVRLVADALRAAALDEGARAAARADLTRLLAEVRAAGEHPPFTVESWDDPEPFAAADAAPVLNAILRNPDARLITLLERLLWLLGLSDGERRFVAALADDAGDFDVAQVYADWLEDDGRTATGARVRRLVPRDGDVIVWRVPPADGPDYDPVVAARPLAQGLCDQLMARGVGTTWVVLPDDSDLSALDPAAVRAAGWVRAEEVRVRLDALAWSVTAQHSGSFALGEHLVDRHFHDLLPPPAPEAPP